MRTVKGGCSASLDDEYKKDDSRSIHDLWRTCRVQRRGADAKRVRVLSGRAEAAGEDLDEAGHSWRWLEAEGSGTQSGEVPVFSFGRGAGGGEQSGGLVGGGCAWNPDSGSAFPAGISPEKGNQAFERRLRGAPIADVRWL